jgi:sigma-E factor negative regulatory protein RseA
MSEDLNQKISQFLDNELNHIEALNLLHKIQSQPELQDKLNRYEAISHAIKTDAFLLTKDDFSKNIRQQIQQEPVYLLPQHKSFKPSHKQIAVAASIVIVAVIAGRSLNDQSSNSRSASILQVAQNQPTEQPVNTTQDAHHPLNKRINEYLQAHNSSVYTNGEANFQPFAKVTAYSHK